MHTPESLAPLTLGDLQRLYAEVLGKPTRCPTRAWLVKQILGAQGPATGAADELAAHPATQPPAPAEEAPAAEAGADDAQAAEAPANTTASPEAAAATEAEADTDAPEEPLADTEPAAAEADPETPAAPAPAAPDSTSARIAAIRGASTLAELDALLAGPGRRVQSVVLAEAAKQRGALERVTEVATDRHALAGLAAGKQADTRPGVGRAIQAALAALGSDSPAADRPLAAMTLPELKAEYERVVGRSTGSDHRGYLIWKIREALKGRITVGAVKRTARANPEVEQRVLPIRMEDPAVEALDAAWKRLGYKTRMAFIRDALGGLLEAKGEGVAAKAIRGAA